MLHKEACVACRGDESSMSRQDATSLLAELPGWELVEEGAGLALRRSFEFSNFVSAQSFANRVGGIAEELDHHPRIVLEWGRVEVVWWTHKINGLHRNDFIAAAKTSELFESEL